MLQYAEWRRAIAEHVAARTGTSADAPLPQVAGHVSLALSLSAYEQWLKQPRTNASGLLKTIDRAMTDLRSYLRA